ncbi:MAG: zinc-binding dehydrogenase [Oscillospiraceae bacterium]
MDTMKVAMVTEPYKVEIREHPIPRMGDGEVLIKVKIAGVCGSDLHLFKGTHPFRQPPAVLGHELAGDIISVGKNVTRFAPGDRVTVLPHVECNACEFCKEDLQNLCTSKIVPGTPKWCGTFAEYFVAPEQTVFKIADGISYEMGALVEPLAVAVHAMRRIDEPKRDSIAILGTGTIGLLCLIVAREMGYKKIYCTDPAPFNREMAIKHGAALAVDPISEDPVKVITEANGRGVDVTLVAAGAPNIIDQASSMTKRRGEVCLVAMITREIPVYTYGFVFNEQRLIGAMTYQNRDFKEAMDMVNGGLDLSLCVTQQLPFSETQKGLDMLDQKKGDIVKIMVYPEK